MIVTLHLCLGPIFPLESGCLDQSSLAALEVSRAYYYLLQVDPIPKYCFKQPSESLKKKGNIQVTLVSDDDD